VVTVNKEWRGKPISEVAANSAKKVRRAMDQLSDDPREKVAQLNLRGVSAVNRNDLRSANTDFRKAYALDPNNAFTLNNIGYVAEQEGDQETAQFFYERAREAGGASQTVGVATKRTAEGKKLFAVAADSDSRVATKVAQQRDMLRRQNEPVALRRRDNSIVDESIQPAPPAIQPAPTQLPQ